MTKALRVVMIVYAIIGIVFGAAMIFIPEQMADWFNSPTPSDFEKYLTGSLGMANIAAAVFIIIAARDPIKNKPWVAFAIVWALIWVVTIVYSMGLGYVDFSQEGIALIIHIVFAVLFLILFP